MNLKPAIIMTIALITTAASADIDVDPANLVLNEGSGLEARFKADINGWDSLLSDNSTTSGASTTGQISNTRSDFENQTFAFDLTYDASISLFSWTITRPDETSNTLTQSLTTTDSFNTIQLFTDGSAGTTSLTNLSFSGMGETLTNSDFSNIDTGPSTGTFAESFLFFGNAADITSEDWTLSGDISFGQFNRNNPNERNKITIQIRQAAVPAPATFAIIGIGGLVSARRRRS
ncbi:MAG: PEP-CTERM sorting domain-containing protein [Phycisphaerales bacterium]